jgi:predicted outer membrane protein
MGKRTSITVFAVVAAAAIGSCDRRPAPETTSNPREEACTTDPAAKTRAVLHYLHRAHESEVRAGNLAADRTRVPEVRGLAKRMVVDHLTADQKLVDLARRERIDLTTPAPADPVHAAALRLETADDDEMQELSEDALDIAYVTTVAARQAFLLEVVDQGEKTAAGDVKSLLDETHDMAARHHDAAVMLMQNLHFAPRAVGGGPTRDLESEPGASAPRRRRETHPGRRDDAMRLDGGAWPPVTAPPERTP